jgi:hypothetical protein
MNAYVSYFDDLEIVDKEVMLAEWDKHLEYRKSLKGQPGMDTIEADDFERKIYGKLNNLEKNKALYYRGLLTRQGYDNLILPHHGHDLNLVSAGGQPVEDVIKKYDLLKSRAAVTHPKCIRKIMILEERFFKQDSDILDAEFIILSNNWYLIHEENYDDRHTGNKLYIGNAFHRLVAYGSSIENGFRKLRVYFCHSSWI